MITTAKLLRGLLIAFGGYLCLLVYKFLVHGRKEAFLFLPFIAVFLVIILFVYWLNKREQQRGA